MDFFDLILLQNLELPALQIPDIYCDSPQVYSKQTTYFFISRSLISSLT
jgi:hypothetical protein